MKKLFALVLALMVSFSLAACGGAATSGSGVGGTTGETFEIAMITDIGDIDDKSFNQGTWEGLAAYAKENNISHTYYKPADQGDDYYLDSIDKAVQNGAKVVVTPGFLFAVPVGTAQYKYPDVTFILIDSNPAKLTADGQGQEDDIAKNGVGVSFAEEQSGYLAGYAAVKDGYTKLGFMGGMPVPAVVRFGFGYVQGANDAAKELDIKVDMKYFYTGGFQATPEAQTMASNWYENAGVEVIFGCGGAVGNSVFAAAEASDGKSIGVDIDQSAQSETIITSAVKGLAEATYKMLQQYYDGTFPGGEAIVLSADSDGVGLPMETSRFKTFTVEDYEALLANLAAGKVKIANNVKGGENVTSPVDMDAKCENVNLDVIEQ